MLTLLLGCTEAIWYPQIPNNIDQLIGDADTAADTGGQDTGSQDTGGQDTGDTGLPCSPADATPAAELLIRNAGPDTVDIFWRAQDCQEYRYHTLFPSSEAAQPSYEGHVWVARLSDGQVVDTNETPPGNTTWEVSP